MNRSSADRPIQSVCVSTSTLKNFLPPAVFFPLLVHFSAFSPGSLWCWSRTTRMPIEYDRFGSPTRRKQQHQPSTSAKKHRYVVDQVVTKARPRQEICEPLKWFCFLLNFLVFLVGVTCLALGIYLCIKDPRPIIEMVDIVLNPAMVLIALGLGTCAISLCGAIGALRDNTFLLKSFSFVLFFAYVILVVATFVLFILFYSDTTDGLSAHSILLHSIENYHANRNLADFVDYLQEQLECCGASSAAQGYKDWELSDQFNCSTNNPYPERCGVPFSCCRRSLISAESTTSADGTAAAVATNPLLPAMRSLECWQNAQTKKIRELETNIYTRGCLHPLKSAFERHAVHIGALVGGLIIPVCLFACCANILAKQIEHQKCLLEREARRYERRKRRERHRFRDPFANHQQQTKSNASSSAPPPVTLDNFDVTTSVDSPSTKVPIDEEKCAGKQQQQQQRRRRVSHHQRTAHVQQRPRSSSPTRRKPPPTGTTGDQQQHQRKRPDRRRRSIAVVSGSGCGAEPVQVQPVRTTNNNWVLQQSDLINPV